MLPRDQRATYAPETSRLIQRQLHSAEVSRFLRRLPGLEVQADLPPQIMDLLGALDEAEAAGRRGRNGSAHAGGR